MRKIYLLLLAVMLCCIGCEWQLKPSDEKSDDGVIIERYDRIQSLYLTTGDFSALQHMSIGYPMQTRTLIEDVLHLGHVNDPEINTKFLNFYQDTTLQTLIADTQQQYVSVDDLNRQLTAAFHRLRKLLPGVEPPLIYAQIGALDQSIVIGDGILGISLDKYLGADYPLYQRYGYSAEQRNSMERSFIVPDCVGFFLLSLYPMPDDHELTQPERDVHIGKIQWVVNRAMQKRVFRSPGIRRVANYMNHHKNVTVAQLLQNNDYASIK